jgi:hypothetical protein
LKRYAAGSASSALSATTLASSTGSSGPSLGHLRDPSEDVRYEAAYGLSFWGERRAAWALLPVLLDPGETPRVRGQAAEGVGCSLGLRRLSPAQRERVRSALDAGLQDPEVELRFWCLYAAGQTRMTELRPRIEHLRDNDPRLCPGLWHVRDEAADVLEYFDTDLWPERDFVQTEGENG